MEILLLLISTKFELFLRNLSDLHYGLTLKMIPYTLFNELRISDTITDCSLAVVIRNPGFGLNIPAIQQRLIHLNVLRMSTI